MRYKNFSGEGLTSIGGGKDDMPNNGDATYMCSTLIYPLRILPVGSAPPIPPWMNKPIANDRFGDSRRPMNEGYRDLVAGAARPD